MLFKNIGPGQFADCARPLGCDATDDGRGVGIADFNNDGRLDVVINNNNAAPSVYLNRLADAGHWLRMKLLARRGGNRDAIGARVQVVIGAGESCRTLTRWVEAGTGFAAQSDPRIHFGLGAAERVEEIRIVWPDGARQQFGPAQLAGSIDKTIAIEQGAGIVDESVLADPQDAAEALGGS